MEDLNEMDMLNRALTGMSPNFSRGEINHKQERDDLDHMSLAALGKRIPPKAAKLLSKEKLIAPIPQIQPQGNQNVFASFDEAPIERREPVNSKLTEKIEELESTVEFYKKKLSLCESYLTDDQKKTYKQDWLAIVIDAAGDDLISVAGKGFKKQKDNNNGEE